MIFRDGEYLQKIVSLHFHLDKVKMKVYNTYMKPRTLDAFFDRVVRTFPAVVLIGPRQSGKTTYLRYKLAKTHQYINLEDPQTAMRAKTDPESFLSSISGRVILDEIQNVPELLVYIKTYIDTDRLPGKWILTGSQNFALMQGVSESLAGRSAVLTLLPFSFSERVGYGNSSRSMGQLMSGSNKKQLDAQRVNLGEAIVRGNYPEIASNDKIDRQAWCGSYISTYLERDIRNLKQVGDLGQFHLFLQACAIRTGQILDLSSLARDIGVSFSTAKRWLSLLETGYQVLLLYPYYRNIGKRLVKRPKLYFTDTGLATYLLGLNEIRTMKSGPYWGSLFETAVVVDIWKRFLHHGDKPSMYYLRTRDDLEIDLVIERESKLDLIEIKSTATVSPGHAASLVRVKRDLGDQVGKIWLISQTDTSFSLLSGVENVGWKDVLLR